MDKEQKNIATPQDEHDYALEAFAVNATKYIGSTTSLLLHSFFFIGIFSLQWFGFSFERMLAVKIRARVSAPIADRVNQDIFDMPNLRLRQLR